VLVKTNRNPRAWLILVPLLTLSLLWFSLKKVLPVSSSAMAIFGQALASLTVGVAVLWLLAHKLSNRNRLITLFLALVIMIVVGLLGAISYGAGEYSQETAGILIFLTLSVFTMLFAFVLTGWQCRKRYSGSRFVLWLAVWTVTVSIVVVLVYVGIALAILSIAGHIPSNLFSVLIQIPIGGLILGGALYAINLPFMILALRSPFFRERFYACLRLKSMATTTGQADTDQLSEQSSSPEIS
jgi:hypothetical protein